MSSILKVDTIQDQSGNNIINESGNVITIGASGDTITVPAGATVSGFTSAGIDDNATSVAITINSSEQVGIGTTSPDHLLHISASSSNAQLKLQRTGSATASYNISASSDSLAFSNQVAGAEVMRVNSTGLGIGTSTIANTLDVNSSAGAVIKITRDSQSSYLQLSTDGSSGQVFSGAGVLKFKTGSSEAGRFDTSGNLLLGTTSSSGFDAGGLPLLVGNGSTHQGLTIYTGTSHTGAIHFADGTGTGSYRGQVNYRHDTDAMTFATSGSEKARFDASGYLLVGKTSAGIATVGVELDPIGRIGATRDANVTALFNRLNSDGEIVRFQKDGTAVGSIGAYGGRLNIGSGDTGIQFNPTVDSIFPFNVSTTANGPDNTVNLGTSQFRFKDIYLGGGAFIGGTGTANKLDDYEEGTWTPAFNAGSAGTALTGSVAYSYYNRGYYTKIGRAVTVNFHANMSNKGTGSGDMWLAGSSLPFASSGVYVASMYQPIFMTKSGQNTYTGVLYGTFDANGGMRIGFYNANSNIAFVQHSAIGNDFTVSGLFTYFV